MAIFSIDSVTGEIVEETSDYDKIRQILADVKRDLDQIGERYGGVYRPSVTVDQRQEILMYIVKAMLSGQLKGI